MQTKLVRVQDPRWLVIPDVVELFLRSPTPVPVPALITGLMDVVARPLNGMWLAVDEPGRPSGYIVIFLPDTPLWNLPQVYAVYADHAGARDALITQGLEWVHEAGYTKVMGFNLVGASDAAYQEAFKQAGRMEVVGKVVTFDASQPARERNEWSISDRAGRANRGRLILPPRLSKVSKAH